MTVWKEHKGVAHLIINRVYLLIKHLWKSQQKNREYNEFFYHSFELVLLILILVVLFFND